MGRLTVSVTKYEFSVKAVLYAKRKELPLLCTETPRGIVGGVNSNELLQKNLKQCGIVLIFSVAKTIIKADFMINE